MADSELDQFCSLFPTEEKLQDTLMEFFSKLQGVSGVRKLQGTTEYGKDIVFHSLDMFGKKRLHACVVKNTPITGSVGSSSGARTVFLQAEQALDTPYVNAIGGEEMVEHVYIISPRAASPNAFESVKGALKHRSGQVEFICGRELLDRFKQHWPGFLAFEGDFLGRYLNDLRMHADSDPNLSAISIRHSIIEPANRALSTVYVQQQLVARTFRAQPRPLSFTPHLLSDAVSSLELQDVLFNLQIASGVLLHARLWSDASLQTLSRWRSAARKVQDVSKRLLSLWEDDFRIMLKGQPAGTTLSRDAVHVKLNVDVQTVSDYAMIVSAAQQSWGEFREKLGEMNKNAGIIRDSAEAIVMNPAYSQFCRIAEAVNRSAGTVLKSGEGREKNFSVEAFDRVTTHLLITAPAGFGKTSLCKQSALRDADRLLSGQGDVLPIYVVANKVSDQEVLTFTQAFLNGEHIRELLKSARTETLPFKRVRLYLDGLDEVPRMEARRALVTAALNVQLSWPVQAIITGRDHIYDDYLREVPRVNLTLLNHSARNELISRSLQPDEDAVRVLQDAVAGQPSLAELMSVPLLGTLVIGVYRRMHQLPESRVSLYDMFIDLLCGGWDLVRHVKRDCRFTVQTKQTILKRLAGQIHAEKKRLASKADIVTAISFSLNKLEGMADELLAELLEDGLLIRSGVNYMFSHFSFQEFLAAKQIADPSGRTQGSALRRYLLGDDWWRDCLGFYIALLNDPVAATNWIHSIANGMNSAGHAVRTELNKRQAFLEAVIATTHPEFEAFAKTKQRT